MSDEQLEETTERLQRALLRAREAEGQVAALREAAQAVVSKASWSEGVSVRALMALRDVLSDTAAAAAAHEARVKAETFSEVGELVKAAQRVHQEFSTLFDPKDETRTEYLCPACGAGDYDSHAADCVLSELGEALAEFAAIERAARPGGEAS